MLSDNTHLTPEFFTNLGAGLLSGQTTAQQIANAGLGAQTALAAQKAKTQADIQKNRTVEMLKRVAPELAIGVEAGNQSPSEAWVQYLKQQQEARAAAQPKWTLQNINGKLLRVDANSGNTQQLGDYSKAEKPNIINAKNGLYNADTGQWIVPPAEIAAQNDEYGLQTIPGVDKDGNPVLMQASKSGKLIQSQMPEGVKVSKEPVKLDAGTEWILLDPISRQPVGRIPKDIAGAERQKVEGKLTGEQIAQLPQTIAKADNALKVIDQAIAHPGREKTTGLNSVLDPRVYIPGTESSDFQAVAKQLEGKAFLEAFESLKGGGQITEVEGQKATQAIARLSLAQSDDAYKQALLDLRAVVEAGRRRAMQQAGIAGQQIQQTPQANPIDSLVDKYRTK